MQPPKTRPGATPGQELRHGDRMTREEFRRLYEAHPDGTKFELIGGVVHMASPLRIPHGEHGSDLALVFGLYKASTPGVRAAENITVVLGEESEPQPDHVLRLTPECGGNARPNEQQYLVGAPELVAEIAHSTAAADLKGKKEDYLAAGVQEYLVVCVERREVQWFHFPSKRKLKPTADGVYRSRVFPGLWLDGPALFDQDTPKLIATVQRGLASEAHAGFARLLEERRSRHGAS